LSFGSARRRTPRHGVFVQAAEILNGGAKCRQVSDYTGAVPTQRGVLRGKTEAQYPDGRSARLDRGLARLRQRSRAKHGPRPAVPPRGCLHPLRAAGLATLRPGCGDSSRGDRRAAGGRGGRRGHLQVPSPVNARTTTRSLGATSAVAPAAQREAPVLIESLSPHTLRYIPPARRLRSTSARVWRARRDCAPYNGAERRCGD
jgi:hypothetical protein